MTKKKPRAAKPVAEEQPLNEQLHECLMELRALQAAFAAMRAERIACESPKATPARKGSVISLTHIADDLDNAIDALQASVARLEDRLLPLLPDELTPVFTANLPESADATLHSRLLLGVNHIRIITGLIDALTNAVQV